MPLKKIEPMTYAEKLRNPRWQKKRLEILDRDEWTCQLCGDKETTLNVHHKSYNGKNPWDTESNQLISYCDPCHWLIEDCKKTEMSVIKVNKIIYKNGDNILFSLIIDPKQAGIFIMITDYSFIEKQPIKNTIILNDEFNILSDFIDTYKKLNQNG